MRTTAAIGILVVYFGVIVEGMSRGHYSAAVTAMAPALSMAVAFLLGSDVIEIFFKRREGGRRDKGPRNRDER